MSEFSNNVLIFILPNSLRSGSVISSFMNFYLRKYPMVKNQYKMDFCVNFFSEHDILAPEYFISEVRWKPFVEGISANLIASSDA